MLGTRNEIVLRSTLEPRVCQARFTDAIPEYRMHGAFQRGDQTLFGTIDGMAFTLSQAQIMFGFKRRVGLGFPGVSGRILPDVLGSRIECRSDRLRAVLVHRLIALLGLLGLFVFALVVLGREWRWSGSIPLDYSLLLAFPLAMSAVLYHYSRRLESQVREEWTTLIDWISEVCEARPA